MAKSNGFVLNVRYTKKLAGKLNELLVNYSIFYQSTLGYNRNIKGEIFFEWHLKFEKLYNQP